MRKFLRSLWVIARNELTDSVRSRRVLIFMILYLAGSLLMYNFTISVMKNAEKTLTESLGLPASSSPGAVANALWGSSFFKSAVRESVENKVAAEQFLSLPPMAVIFFLVIFIFTPPLIILSTSGRISEELGNGSSRFVLLRATRPAWCLGKFIGQALEIILPLMLSVIGAWSITRFRLPGLHSTATLSIMIVYAGKVWIYSLPFIGFGLGVSQMTTSQNKALIISCSAWIGMVILYHVSEAYVGDGLKQLWLIVGMVVPMSHKVDLQRTDLPHVLHASFYLVTLSMVYLFTGYAILSRRDI